MNLKNNINIIYITTSEKGPSGGAKIIYSHSEQINKLNIKNLTSEVVHIKKRKTSKWKSSIKKAFSFELPKYSGWNASDITVDKNFREKWFKSKVRIKKDLNFDQKKDFVIFPEIFSHFAEKLCIKKKIPYAIFALNGYSLNPTNDIKTLENVYKSSKFILSVSQDISNCVKTAFPFCENKIIKVSLSIDRNKLHTKTKKINLITYMPRKMPVHSETLIFFLRNYLPKSWKIKKIENLKEDKVYKLLLSSKIFLSFTQSEGLGMPPIEAAIAGNKVVGYTGEGGKEIWKKPIFTEIHNGDVINFVKQIIVSTKKLFKSNPSTQRKKLIKKFSKENEKLNLIKMLRHII